MGGLLSFRRDREAPQFEAATATRAKIFVQGLVVTAFTPKSLIFITAFPPRFLDGARFLG